MDVPYFSARLFDVYKEAVIALWATGWELSTAFLSDYLQILISGVVAGGAVCEVWAFFLLHGFASCSCWGLEA